MCKVGNRNHGAVPRQEFQLDGVALGGDERGVGAVSPSPSRPGPRAIHGLWDEADQRAGCFDIALEAFLSTEVLRARGLPPNPMSASNATDLYSTLAQLVAHHTCGGCNLAPDDLFGTGTISSRTVEGYGSLMELSPDGTRPTILASGETRSLLKDGDEVTFRAHCRRPGFATIGFGKCRARIG
jgi:fumarylacetoacetase